MGNEKKIPTINPINFKSPLSMADSYKIDQSKRIDFKKLIDSTKSSSLDVKKTEGDPKKIIDKSKISLGSVPSNKQNTPAKQNANKCSSFCRTKGFNIVPLRYSVTIDKKNPLPSNLGKNVKDIALSKFGYTVEMVNNGYIYCLTKRAKSGFKGNWSGYKVTPKGFLSYFVVEKNKPAPADVNEFACQTASHQFAGSVITIEERTSDPATEAYIIYTQAPMSDAKRAEYEKSADAFVSQGKWQKVKVGGGAAQEHCFGEGQIDSAIHNIKSFGNNRIKLMKEKFKAFPNAFLCIGLYDAVGITLKLNEFRNIKSFGRVNDFLNEKENGITNNHKLQTLNLIDNLEKSINEKIIKTKYTSIDAQKNTIVGHIQYDLRIILSKEQRDRISKNIEQNHEKNSEILAKRAKANIDAVDETKKGFKKYQDHLDLTAISNFRTKVNKISENGYVTALAYQDDHYHWLISTNLINGLYYFDQEEELKSGKVKHGSNGFIFHAVIMDMMYGMNFIQKGKDLLNSWIFEKKVSEKNLFLRAYTYNNKKLAEEYNNIFASEILSKNKVDYAKQGFDSFTAADAAFDEWLNSVSGKNFINSSDFKRPDKFFYFMSLMLNSAFKEFSGIRMKTLHVTQISVMAQVAAQTHTAKLLYLKSGPLAQQIPLSRMMYNVEFREAARAALPPSSGVAYTYRNTRATEVKNAVTLSIKNKPEITKNRILAIVGIFEMLNFYFQYDAWEKDVDKKPEIAAQLVGSSMTLLSVAFAALGESFHAKGKVVASSASAFRISSAALGTIGGIIGLYVDGKNLKETKSNIIRSVLIIRFGVTFALTLGQVGSLLSTVAPHLRNSVVRNAALRFSSQSVVAFFAGARVIAGLTLISIGLVILESLFKKWFLDNEMQDWCKKTSFRKLDSKEKVLNDVKVFKDEDEEFQSFVKAIVSI